jgi:hypothetical protein
MKHLRSAWGETQGETPETPQGVKHLGVSLIETPVALYVKNEGGKMIKTYRYHDCERKHRSRQTLAKCMFPRAIWIHGRTVSHALANRSVSRRPLRCTAMSVSQRLLSVGMIRRCALDQLLRPRDRLGRINHPEPVVHRVNDDRADDDQTLRPQGRTWLPGMRATLTRQ